MAGNITIIPPKDNFLKVSKDIVYNGDVDALSLGVYVKVIALGRKWNLNVPGLAKILNLSVAKIKSVFATLEEAGYLRRCRVKGDAGRFVGWDYEVFSEPTDHPKNRPSVNTDIGENRPSENDPLYIKTTIVDKDIKLQEEDKEKKGFDFFAGLVELGVSTETARDWMAVRRNKKAVNTKTALDTIRKEIEKAKAHGFTAEDCIRLSASESWRGFKAEYIVKGDVEVRQTAKAPAGDIKALFGK